MGEPIQRAYGATDRRETLFYFDPHTINIVGLDSPEQGVLADPDRVALGADEAMVQSIMAQGINTPVTVRKNGKKPDGSPNTELIVGRGRVMACREAWRRLRAAGVAVADLPLVPAISSRGSDEDLLAVALAENLVRREETPLSAAKKAAQFYRITKDKKRTAVVCGVTEQTLESWLKVLELAAPVREHIEAGRVSATQAVALLRDVPTGEQPARMAQLIAEGKVRGNAARSEVRRAREPSPSEGGGAVHLPTKRQLRRLRDVMAEDDFPEQSIKILDFVLDGKPLRGDLGKAWKRVAS